MADDDAERESYSRVGTLCRNATVVIRSLQLYTRMQKSYSAELKLVTTVEKVQLAAIGASMMFQLVLNDALPNTQKPIPPEIAALMTNTCKEIEAFLDSFVSELSAVVNSLCNAESIVSRVNRNLEDALYSPETNPGKAIIANCAADFTKKAVSMGSANASTSSTEK